MPHTRHARRFGAKLRQLRKQRQMTMQTLAAALGTSSGYVSNIENGKVTPNIDFAVRVAQFFEVSLDQLLRDDREITADMGTQADADDR